MSFHYTVYIYARISGGIPVYDVEAHIGHVVPRASYRTEYGQLRRLVRTVHGVSDTSIGLSTFTGYFHWKFKHCQLIKGLARTRGCFAGLACGWEWLMSIIYTEFDYHIGRRRCFDPQFAAYLAYYRSSQYAGFGPAGGWRGYIAVGRSETDHSATHRIEAVREPICA